jgi:putative toxin-antitoxin system antitoxin component (TIGR02293 family)
MTYAAIYNAPVTARIGLIREGVAAVVAKEWLDLPELGRNATLKALDLAVATFNRKVKERGTLSPAESERVLGLARLVGQVEAMVRDAGTPEGFDARAWLARWLQEPLPALGHARPLDLLNTMEGQRLVSDTLAKAASGAYA